MLAEKFEANRQKEIRIHEMKCRPELKDHRFHLGKGHAMAWPGMAFIWIWWMVGLSWVEVTALE